MRKDPGARPPSTLKDNKDKPVYKEPKNYIDRGQDRRRALAIKRLEDVFGYGIHEEINFDEYETVESFIMTTPGDEVKSHTPSMKPVITLSPEEIIAKQQEITRMKGPMYGVQLPDPYAPLPSPPVISGEVE